MTSTPPAYEGWAIVEVLGHRRVPGYVRPVTMYGAEFARIDTPEVNGQPAQTRYVGGSSIYMLHPCDETIAMAAAATMPEPPVSRWEIRQALPATAAEPPANPGERVRWEPGADDYPDDYEQAAMVAYTNDPAITEDHPPAKGDALD